MVAVGFLGAGMELLLMLLATSGGVPTDLASLIGAEPYFKARSIEVKADKLAELAAKGSDDGQAPIAQLLAIRWLGEHPKEGKAARMLLEEIAAGKKARDRLGFAPDYARRALARLDGKAPPVWALPADSVRGEALRWFPDQCTLFGALDVRAPRGVKMEATPDLGKTLRTSMASMMGGPRFQQEMFTFADAVGNIRIDRVSFGMIPDPANGRMSRIFMRLTGLGDHKRLLAFIRKEARQAVVKEQKGARGETVTLIDMKGDGPGMALVGDHDMLIAGYTGGREQNHFGVLEDALRVRAGKKDSIVLGSYAGTLKNVSGQASALLVGDLPDPWLKDMTSGGSPFKAFPKSFTVSLLKTTKGLDFKFTGGAASGQEAKAFVASVEAVKQMGLEGLKHLPAFIKLQPKAVESLQAALKSIKVEAQDALLTGSAQVSNAALRATEEMMRQAMVNQVQRFNKIEAQPNKKIEAQPKKR